MFGYLFPTKSLLSLSERKIFRDYYCAICLAHRYRYGYLATLLNNYDIGVFAIVMNIYNDRVIECGNCGKRIPDKKGKFSAQKWTELVDLNINLVRKKMDDDLNDQFFIKAGLRKLPFLNIFRKCKNKNTHQFLIFDNEFDKFTQLEAKKPGFAEINDAYELFVRKTFGSLSYVNNDHLNLLVELNKWIYWIDAIEDYDKDKRQKNYNPFHQNKLPVDKTRFLQDNLDALRESGKVIEQAIMAAYTKCSYPTKNKIILENIIETSIPQTTLKVLNQQVLKKRRRLL